MCGDQDIEKGEQPEYGRQMPDLHLRIPKLTMRLTSAIGEVPCP